MNIGTPSSFKSPLDEKLLHDLVIKALTCSVTPVG